MNINGAVADILRADNDLAVTTAELVDDGDGVPEDVLARRMSLCGGGICCTGM